MLIRQVLYPTRDFTAHFIAPDYFEVYEKTSDTMDTAIVVVATDDAREHHMGCAIFAPQSKTGYDYKLVDVRVVPEYEGQGVGRALIEKGIELVREIGGKRINANLFAEDMEYAGGFMEEMGFSFQEERHMLSYRLRDLEHSRLLSYKQKLSRFTQNVKKPEEVPRNLLLHAEYEYWTYLEDPYPKNCYLYVQDNVARGLLNYLSFANFYTMDCIRFSGLQGEEKKLAYIALLYCSLENLLRESDRISDKKIYFSDISSDMMDTFAMALGQPEETVSQQQYVLKLSLQ